MHDRQLSKGMTCPRSEAGIQPSIKPLRGIEMQIAEAVRMEDADQVARRAAKLTNIEEQYNHAGLDILLAALSGHQAVMRALLKKPGDPNAEATLI